jgi:hypothetical protein
MTKQSKEPMIPARKREFFLAAVRLGGICMQEGQWKLTRASYQKALELEIDKKRIERAL